MLRLARYLSSVFFCAMTVWPATALAQSFSINPSQIEVVIIPGINHLPFSVPLSYNPSSFNPAALSANSDMSWVSPEIDVANGAVRLSFATTSLTANSTATITVTDGITPRQLFVKATVTPMNIIALKDDPVRSRTYGIQQNSGNLGSIVVFDPIQQTYVGSITVDQRPCDFDIKADGSEMLVIHNTSKTLKAIDLDTLTVTETINLTSFGTWSGPADTSAHVAYGAGNIIYYVDSSWGPVLWVMDRSTRSILQQTNITPGTDYGWGDLVVSNDKSMLFGWAQYGWSAGYAGSYISKYTIRSDGTLAYVSSTASNYPTTLSRDPLNTPALISADNLTVFLKQLAVSANAVNTTLHSFPSPIYAISPNAEIACTQSAIYESATGNKLYNLPVTTTVQAITSDYARLVYFNPTSKTLQTLNLLQVIGPTILGRDVSPANQSITLAPSSLQWTPLPGVDRYHVYLGTSATAVGQATTSSPEYSGEVVGSSFALGSGLQAGVTYYWRVDAVTNAGSSPGDVMSFTVSSIAANVSSLSGATVQGHASYQTAVTLTSTTAGLNWSANSSAAWIGFSANTGITPASLQITLDASQLNPGLNQGQIIITTPDGPFAIPVKLQVDALALTLMRSDPASSYVYAISEGNTTGTPQAYLLEIDTQNQSIKRVVPTGSGVTDLAIHHGDNRVYVTNWVTGSLLAVNLDSFAVERSYAFSPFAGTGYTHNDVYRISPGGPGRLMVEGEDQWINISILDTTTGATLATRGMREGGGATDPSGRYYYHGDDNISSAYLNKFDTNGDQLGFIVSIQGPGYGSRTVVVSENGQFVFWDTRAYDQNLNLVWNINDTIYSTTADGRFAFANSKIYDTTLKTQALAMPVNTTVSAYNSSSDKLVVQVGSRLGFYPINNGSFLPAPLLTASNTTATSVALTWTDQSLETGFTLQKRIGGNLTWQDISSNIAANSANYTVTGLLDNTAYEFRIKADAPAVSSAWSNVLAVTTPATPPATPTLNAPTAVGANSLNLTWSVSGSYDSLVIERAPSGSGNWTVIATLGSGITQFTDTNLSPSTTYDYRLKTVKGDTSSSYTTARTVTTASPPTPSTPANLYARTLSADSIRVTWTDSTNETGYRLERTTDDSVPWTLVATLPADTVSYTDTGLENGTQYSYRVQATGITVNSSYSNVDSAYAVNLIRLIEDDFDPALDSGVWQSIVGGTVRSGGAGFPASNVLWFGSAGTRTATTVSVDVSLGGYITVKIRAGNTAVDGSTNWENSETGESVVIEYSIAGGPWTLMGTYNTVYPSLNAWATVEAKIPAAARTSQTAFRWRQLSNSGASFDVWALDEFYIETNAPPAPSPPPFIIAAPLTDTSVAVSWQASAGASSYLVQRSPDNVNWATIGTVPASSTYFTDTNRTPTTWYSYRIVAINAGGNSAASTVAWVKTYTQLEAWRLENFGTMEVNTRTDSLTTDTDGVPNLSKFAFNLSVGPPAVTQSVGSGTQGLPATWLDANTGQLYVEFVRRKSSTNPGVTYTVEFSEDLVHWSGGGVQVQTVSIDPLWERVRYADTSNLSTTPRRFARVRVTQQ